MPVLPQLLAITAANNSRALERGNLTLLTVGVTLCALGAHVQIRSNTVSECVKRASRMARGLISVMGSVSVWHIIPVAVSGTPNSDQT